MNNGDKHRKHGYGVKIAGKRLLGLRQVAVQPNAASLGSMKNNAFGSPCSWDRGLHRKKGLDEKRAISPDKNSRVSRNEKLPVSANIDCRSGCDEITDEKECTGPMPFRYGSDMRTSSQRTSTAIVRAITGLTTSQFGQLVGISVSAVEKLESERLRLSEDVASRISLETGVDHDWLFFEKGGTPRLTGTGGEFTKHSFDQRRLAMSLTILLPCVCGETSFFGESELKFLGKRSFGYFVYGKCGHLDLRPDEPFASIEEATKHWNAEGRIACTKSSSARLVGQG